MPLPELTLFSREGFQALNNFEVHYAFSDRAGEMLLRLLLLLLVLLLLCHADRVFCFLCASLTVLLCDATLIASLSMFSAIFANFLSTSSN
jgi:hypothetical protein